MTTCTNFLSFRAQYDQAKAPHAGSIVGFSMGAFTEFFFDDAQLVSKTLGIVLTQRGMDVGQPVPTASIVTQQLPVLMKQLEDAGFTVHISARKTAAEPANDDVVPLAFDSLSDDELQDLKERVMTWEKHRLRAATLHDRLAASGLGREADQLRVRELGNYSGLALLDLLNAIVSKLISGGHTDLCRALADSAGADALLASLNNIHCPQGPIATGERLAAIVTAKTDDELRRLALAPGDAEALVEQIEQSADSLQIRLALAEDALERLHLAGIARGGPLQ